MEFLEPNALLKGEKKTIHLTNGIRDYYHIWKSLRKKFGETSEIEAFVIGYMLGNNIMLREKFINEKKFRKNIQKSIIAKYYEVNK